MKWKTKAFLSLPNSNAGTLPNLITRLYRQIEKFEKGMNLSTNKSPNLFIYIFLTWIIFLVLSSLSSFSIYILQFYTSASPKPEMLLLISHACSSEPNLKRTRKSTKHTTLFIKPKLLYRNEIKKLYPFLSSATLEERKCRKFLLLRK